MLVIGDGAIPAWMRVINIDKKVFRPYAYETSLVDFCGPAWGNSARDPLAPPGAVLIWS
jgi:hypothetical protein